MQQAASVARTESQSQIKEPQNQNVLPDPAVLCDRVRSRNVGDDALLMEAFTGRDQGAPHITHAALEAARRWVLG